MNFRKVKAIYSICIGVSIMSLWMMLFMSGQIPELETELFSISLHIFSELLLAITLIVSGISLLKQSKKSEKLFLLAMGLLLYSVINAAGYYGESKDWAIVIMFALIGLVSTILIIMSLKKED